MLYKEVIKVWSEGEIMNLLDRFFIKFTYCSLKMEDDHIKLRDVESIFRGEKVVDFNADENMIRKVENHKKLGQKILKLSKENNSKLSIGLVKKIHRILMTDCINEELLLRDEITTEDKKGYNASSVGAEEKLGLLIDKVNNVEITENNSMEIVGYFLCSFQAIHPFVVGTGIVGRILINYLLIGNNLPPIIIFYYDKEKYYSAIEYFFLTQEIDNMAKFLEEAAYKTWVKDYNVKTKCLKDFL